MIESNNRKTVLDNGIRIVTETLPGRTVSLGIFINVGARDEGPETNGCAHFAEHMLFKGTPSRNAIQVARELDGLGGASNAFTSKETTCLYATVLDSQLPRLISVYTDLFLNSEFVPQEVERERTVILQEIDMVQDSPEDLVHDFYSSCIWGSHPLSNTVLGLHDVVASMSSESLKEYVRQRYSPEKIIIAAAGNVQHDQFVDLLTEKFSRLGARGSTEKHAARGAPFVVPVERKIYSRPFEQMHMVLGTYGVDSKSEDRYAQMLLNVIAGGNMSSRLFQEVREKRGLAYSIYSFAESNYDSGQIGVYTGVNPKNVKTTLEIIEDILAELGKGTISMEELEDAKGYARASLYLSAENMDSRMLRLARNELFFNRYVSFQEVDTLLKSVSYEEINSLAEKLFSNQLHGVLLGPLDGEDISF